jgi:Tfp pilus assembly protein PilV
MAGALLDPDGVRMRAIERHDGFSLIEAVLASGVLAVGVLALAQLFAVATNAFAAAERMTSAAILAAQKIEELRSLPCCAPAEGIDRIGAYTRAWSVQPLAAGPDAAVTIEVEVAPGGVRAITVRFRTVP